MGKYNKGILGPFYGKVGNVVGSRWCPQRATASKAGIQEPCAPNDKTLFKTGYLRSGDFLLSSSFLKK